MDQKLVAKALFKKLSALRATLSDDEQALLDSMVEGEFEVDAHRVAIRSRAATKRAMRGEDEAAAHGMVKGATAAVVKGVTMDEDEATAHGMVKGATAAVVKGVTMDEDEAAAHGMVKGATADARKRSARDTDEAAAHGMVKGATADARKRSAREADEAVAHSSAAAVFYRVIFNPDDDAYNVD